VANWLLGVMSGSLLDILGPAAAVVLLLPLSVAANSGDSDHSGAATPAQQESRSKMELQTNVAV
jgi:hypothetical protein